MPHRLRSSDTISMTIPGAWITTRSRNCDASITIGALGVLWCIDVAASLLVLFFAAQEARSPDAGL